MLGFFWSVIQCERLHASSLTPSRLVRLVRGSQQASEAAIVVALVTEKAALGLSGGGPRNSLGSTTANRSSTSSSGVEHTSSGGLERKAPVVSSSGRRADAPAPADEPADEPAPLIKEADPEFEKLLEEEEQIERATREQSQTPNFRPGDD